MGAADISTHFYVTADVTADVRQRLSQARQRLLFEHISAGPRTTRSVVLGRPSRDSYHYKQELSSS